MLKSSLCDYSDTQIIVKRRIKLTGAGDDAAARQADERNKGKIFKSCLPFITCKSEINNTEIDNAKYIDTVTPMCNLIENSDNYSKKSGSLQQYYKDSLADSKLFKSKVKKIGNTLNNGNTKHVEIIAPLKY